jgi:hypothetical protein
VTNAKVSASAAIQATKLAYSNSTSGLYATSVQAAIDELASTSAITIRKITGAVGDGVTDDTAAVNAFFASLQSGDIVDLQGQAYKYNGNGVGSPPDNIVFINGGTFDISGSPLSTLFMAPTGAAQALTYTGGNIAAGATTITNLSGLTAADIGKELEFAHTTTLIGPSGYFIGEKIVIRGVSGTTITLDHPTAFAYNSTGLIIRKITLKKNIHLGKLNFIGDPAKQHRGVLFTYCGDCTAHEVNGTHMMHYTVGMLGCTNVKASGKGVDYTTTTDNGLLYWGVIGNACVSCSAFGHGEGLRHTIANCAGNGTDFGTVVGATMRAGKDSCVDFHSNCMLATVLYAISWGYRTGGTFSNQATALTVQCGGVFFAKDVISFGYDTTACLVQPLQNTNDNFNITGMAIGASANATRAIDIQVQKPSGRINIMRIVFDNDEMAHASSAGIYFDTAGSGAGVTIGSLSLAGINHGKAFAKRAVTRSGNIIDTVITEGVSHAKTAGGWGVDVIPVVANDIKAFVMRDVVHGVAGSFGARATGCTQSVAASGSAVLGVGGTRTGTAFVGFTVVSPDAINT